MPFDPSLYFSPQGFNQGAFKGRVWDLQNQVGALKDQRGVAGADKAALKAQMAPIRAEKGEMKLYKDLNKVDGSAFNKVNRGPRPVPGAPPVAPGGLLNGGLASGITAANWQDLAHNNAPVVGENYGMLSSGTPMRGDVNSQIVMSNDELVKAAGAFGGQSALSGLQQERSFDQGLGQKTYNEMQGGGYYGGLLNSDYSTPWQGIANTFTDATASPGTNLNWQQPIAPTASPAAPAGPGQVAPVAGNNQNRRRDRRSAWGEGQGNNGSAWGGVFKNK